MRYSKESPPEMSDPDHTLKKTLANLSPSEKQALLARLLRTRSQALSQADAHVPAFLQDATLAPEIKPGAMPNGTAPEGILLTGATGFLGAHLLRDFCGLTNAHVYCLVRAESSDLARERINRNFEKYFDCFPDAHRITALPGDLAAPRLGLSEDRFETLSREVDSLWHCGAHLNHLYGYDRLKASNVSSTVEMLKLAMLNRPKRVAYVSSLVAAVEKDEDGSLLEDFPSAHPGEIFGGYAQTKWVSERLMAQAFERGFAVRLFRPGLICGQRDRGIWSFEHDHLLRVLKGCIQMQCAPASDWVLDMAPVDFVSEAMVRFSLLPGQTHHVFNLSNPAAPTWNRIIDWTRDAGYPMEVVPTDVWKSERLPGIQADNALFPVLPLYLNLQDVEQREMLISKLGNVHRNNTLHALQTLGMPFSEIDAKRWGTYLTFLGSSGFLQE